MYTGKSQIVKGKQHELTPAPQWQALMGPDWQEFFANWTRDSLNSEFAFTPEERLQMLEAA